MDITVDFEAPKIIATSTLTVTVTQDGITSLPVDLDDALAVTGVTVDGVPRFYTQLPEEVSINLGGAQALGTELDVAVSYRGLPDLSETGNKGLRFRTHAGEDLVYTLSTPFSNSVTTNIPISRYWRACKDQPDDKSTYSCAITVPSTMVACSNGAATGSTDNGDGTSTYTFDHTYPISPYLVTFAATNYALIESTYGSMPITHYAFPEDLADATFDWSNTAAHMATVAGIYGEYPFLNDKYGHYQIMPGPAIEHQTMVTIPGNIITGTGSSSGSSSTSWDTCGGAIT